MRHNWFLALHLQPQPEIQDEQACFLLWFQHVFFLYELEVGHTVTRVKTFQNLEQGVIGASFWKQQGLEEPCEKAGPSLLSADPGTKCDLTKGVAVWLLLKPHFWVAPNFHSQAEGHSSDSQTPRDIPPRLKSSGSPWVPALSPLTHGARPCQRWAPVYSAGRGGQPGHQHLWKMKEVEADPCAEAKGLQPGPRQGWEGELAGERRGEGKGTCPKRWGIILRGRDGNSKQLCDGRGRSPVGGGEVTQDWERPVLHWQGQERKVS